MKNHHTPLPSSASQSFDRRDFRLSYLDLYAPPMQTTAASTDVHPAMRIVPTDEFPVLRDLGCNALVEGATLQHMDFMGTAVGTSNVGLQGWAERVCRASGLQGLEAPDTWPARAIFRWRVWLRLVRFMASRNASRDLP